MSQLRGEPNSMKPSPISGEARILFVCDNAEVLSWSRLLENAGYHVSAIRGCDAAIEQIDNGLKPDLVLLNLDTPSLDDLRTIQICLGMRANLKMVVISKVIDVSAVVQAMRWGALDYISRPQDGTQLLNEVQRLLAASDHDQAQPEPSPQFEEIENHISFLAVSPAMRKIRAQAAQVAKVDIPVLLLGESGVGKEVLARLIHKLSRRAGKSMVKVNCAALPADLVESELFGYEPGAFTGANRSKPGTLELCDKGTVFLDEIGEMSPTVQAKLLHVLQDGKFSRLGGRSSLTSDFRVLAATNINVKEAIRARAFREDLYYRLNAFTINVPPLRERSEEIPILVRHFMQQFAEK